MGILHIKQLFKIPCHLLVWNEAKELKYFFEALFGIVEKILDNASLWFWLLVFAIGALWAQTVKLVDLSAMNSSPTIALQVSAGLIFCLWMHSLRSHQPVLDAFRKTYTRISKSMAKKRQLRKRLVVRADAKEKLLQILRTKCAERRWLLWFINHETERSQHSPLPYEVIDFDIDNVHKPAKTLFREGVLHRTGDSGSSLVFFHKSLHSAYLEALESDLCLRTEVEDELEIIRSSQELNSLKEKLQSFHVLKFTRAMER